MIESVKIKYHPAYEGEKECSLQWFGQVPLIKFTAFEGLDFIIHGFSTRLGGVSGGYFESLNLSYSRGDSKENVDENYERAARALGIGRNQLVFTNQVHGTCVCYARKEKSMYPQTDGLVTDEAGLVIATSYADCVPLYLVDVKKKVIGHSHSGWRGTKDRMGQITIEKMKEEFGSSPEDMIAVIGPSICRDCYEVSQDVALEFKTCLTGENYKKAVFPKENGKYHLDLWKANAIILEEAGVLKENIHVAGICTCCNSTLLFSHRASNGRRGNLNGFLGKAF